MKKKLFGRLCLMLAVGLALVACSDDEGTAVKKGNAVEPDELGMYHYQLDLNCAVPGYDDAGSTRSVVYTWENASTLIVRFKSGSKYIDGLATYSSADNLWSVGTYEVLPVISGEGTCELYYFYGASSVKDTNVAMNENTACYYTTTATYEHPSEASISVNGSLERKTWRLRFKGTSGTKITLPAESNDIKYFSSFDGQTGDFASAQKNIELTVKSDGYTPYIYGTFVHEFFDNNITVYNGNSGFEKFLTSTDLPVGESAYLTIPSENSYSGWSLLADEVDPDATVQVNEMVTFTDGIVMNWNFGSSASTFDYSVLTKSAAEELSDNQIVNKIYGDDPYSSDYFDYNYKTTNSSWFTPNAEYYLCAVAKNNSGVRGPVLRQLFRTKAVSLPYAEISNVKTESTSKWIYNITLKNNAKSYYLVTSTSESVYNKDWHWFAFDAHRYAVAGELEARDWETVATTLSSGTCSLITICTWAMDAKNNIGNSNVAYGNVSSSAKAMRPVAPAPQKDVMSPAQMQRLRDDITVYRMK